MLNKSVKTILEKLRSTRREKRERLHARQKEQAITAPHALTYGQRMADGVTQVIGSWRFIIVQSVLLASWIIGNILFGHNAWDPYPFILLNLLLSFQAAYTAPAIMMSQSRQDEVDRKRAESDLEINIKAELEIELLHEKLDLLKENELKTLTDAIRQLTMRLDALSPAPDSSTCVKKPQ